MNAQSGPIARPHIFLKHHGAHLVALLCVGALQVLATRSFQAFASGGSLVAACLVAAVLWLAVPYGLWQWMTRQPQSLNSHEQFIWHLELPGRLTWRLTASYALGALLVPALALQAGVSAIVAFETAVLGVMLCLLLACVSMLRVEEELRDSTIEALAQALEELREEHWRHGPTLALVLPLMTLSSVGAALMLAALSVAGHAGLPVVGLLSVLLLALTGLTIILLLKRHDAANDVLRKSVARLGSGLTPTLWMSGDETGQVVLAVQRAHEKSANQTFVLRHAGLLLHRSVGALTEATSRQSEMMSTQSHAIQETSATATEIRQASEVAAQKASEVLLLAERAEEARRQGEEAVDRSLGGLANIGEKVQAMAERVSQLDGHLRQVTTITILVKDLADQSNMLALNAAIEAARAGEQGRGFSVVAREIRSLADQSIQSTRHIQKILNEIADSALAAVEITKSGLNQVSESLAEVRTSRENIRQLSSIAHENAIAVRQIAAAVNQQNAGVGQIFEAVRSLSDMMDETLRHLENSQEAISLVESVSGEVMEVVRSRASDAGASEAQEEEHAAAA